MYRFWIERRIAKIAGFLGIFLYFSTWGKPKQPLEANFGSWVLQIVTNCFGLMRNIFDFPNIDFLHPGMCAVTPVTRHYY
jgi:hypothetical protein